MWALGTRLGRTILVPRGRAPFSQHQESRFLVLTKRSAASGDENGVEPACKTSAHAQGLYFQNRFILVPRGRAPFGQHQESRPLASQRSNDWALA